MDAAGRAALRRGRLGSDGYFYFLFLLWSANIIREQRSVECFAFSGLVIAAKHITMHMIVIFMIIIIADGCALLYIRFASNTFPLNSLFSIGAIEII